MSKTLYLLLLCTLFIQVIHCQHGEDEEQRLQERGILGKLQHLFFKILPLLKFIKRLFNGTSGPIGRALLSIVKWLPFLLLPIPIAKLLKKLLGGLRLPFIPTSLPPLLSYPSTYRYTTSSPLVGSLGSGLGSSIITSSPRISTSTIPLGGGSYSYSSTTSTVG